MSFLLTDIEKVFKIAVCSFSQWDKLGNSAKQQEHFFRCSHLGSSTKFLTHTSKTDFIVQTRNCSQCLEDSNLIPILVKIRTPNKSALLLNFHCKLDAVDLKTYSI